MIDMTPLIIVGLVSLVMSFLLALSNKILVDQDKVKEIKAKLNGLKKKMNDAQKSGNQKEVQKYVSQMMKASQEQMRMNTKPMLMSFIIIIPVLGLLGGMYSDIPVNFDGNNTAFFNYQNLHLPVTKSMESGNLIFQVNGESKSMGNIVRLNGDDFEINKNCRFVFFFCSEPEKEIKLSRIVVWLPFSFPFFGNNFGWLGWYILLSFPFTQLFRKLLGVI